MVTKTERFELRARKELLDALERKAKALKVPTGQLARIAIAVFLNVDPDLAKMPRGRPWPKKRKPRSQ